MKTHHAHKRIITERLKHWFLTGCVCACCGSILTRATAQTPLQIAQQAYLKAPQSAPGNNFGFSVAADGDTVVVGALHESSNASGVDGNPYDNSAYTAGAAYVFVRNGTNWSQQAYLKASNTEAEDQFGISVAISGDTIIVGANLEDSSARGVNGDQNNNSARDSGAAYVFVRNGTNWSQQAYLKASNAETDDTFGQAVAISGDTIAVGAFYEGSSATGVNGNQADNGTPVSGAAYVFVRTETNWIQQAYLKASNTGGDDGFGITLALADDTLVVGALWEDSIATGVNGNQFNNSAADSGAAYVFVRTGSNRAQQAYLKASNTGVDDQFSYSIAVSRNTIVIGANAEASNATGVNGNQNNNSLSWAGAAYVFVRNGTNWSQQAYLKASNPGQYVNFGVSVALLGDILAVGAVGESSAQSDGAVYVFARHGTNWTQEAYLKASNTGGGFGSGTAVTEDTVVVGAAYERSNATGVNGDQNDISAVGSGAAYVFSYAVPILPELSLTAARNGDILQLAAAGTTNTQWRLEFRDTLTSTNAWQPLTNITLGPSPFILAQPLASSSRFYRGVWLP